MKSIWAVSIIASILILGTLGFSQEAEAATFTATQDGDWTDGATWVGGVAPPTTIPSTDTVNIPSGITVTIGTFGVNGILNNSGTLISTAFSDTFLGIFNNFGTFNNLGEFQNSGTINNSGIVNNNSGSSFFFTGGTFNNLSGGTLNLNSGFFGPAFDVGIINNSGTINNNTPGTFNGGTFNNLSGGTFNNNSGSSLNIDSGNTFNNNAGATFNNNSGGTINNLGTINNSGTITTNSGGTFNNNSGGTINNNSGGTINNSGTLDIFTSVSGGTINNLGIINNGPIVFENLLDILLSGKITICHNDSETITISLVAFGKHFLHGDTIGECP